MYYQVGNKCLEQSQAEKRLFQLGSTSNNPRRQIIKPEYNGTVWKLNGQTIKADLPKCDPSDNLKSGLETGWLLFGVMAAVYFRIRPKKGFSNDGLLFLLGACGTCFDRGDFI